MCSRAPARPAAFHAADGRKGMLRRPLEGSQSIAVFVSKLQLDSLRFIWSELWRSSAHRKHGLLERGIPSPDIPWPALSQLMTVYKPLPWTALVPSALPVLPCFCHHVPGLSFPPLLTISREMFSPALRNKRETPTKPNKVLSFTPKQVPHRCSPAARPLGLC